MDVVELKLENLHKLKIQFGKNVALDKLSAARKAQKPSFVYLVIDLLGASNSIQKINYTLLTLPFCH